ncbi:hypothetical protein [Beduini sp.]|uniref:hypothetical protein n=1 Tax=Beduini sp. TaxID=1922300 RepID=UPI0039A1261A
MKINSFDGNVWTIGNSSKLECYNPKLITSQGNLYIFVSSLTGDGNTKIYYYDDDIFIQEGTSLDSAGKNFTLSSFNNRIYIGYVQNNNNNMIKIKQKDINNEVLSVQVTPPKKTVYKQGEKLDFSGLTVIANY